MAAISQDSLKDIENSNTPRLLLTRCDDMISSTPVSSPKIPRITPKTTSDLIKAKARDLSSRQQLEKQLWLDHVANLEQQLREKDLVITQNKENFEAQLQRLQGDVNSLTLSVQAKEQQVEELKKELSIITQSDDGKLMNFRGIINQQDVSCYTEMTTEEARQFISDMDSAMQAFITKERKVLSDDESADFLKKQQTALLNFMKVWQIEDDGSLFKVKENLNSTIKKNLIQNWDNLLHQTDTMVQELNKQLDVIKKSKITYLPYYELMIKLKSIIQYEATNSKNLLKTNATEDISIVQELKTNLAPFIEEIIKKVKSDSSKEENHNQPTYPKKYHSILLKPSSSRNINQILPILEGKIANSEMYPKIVTSRKTKNNNIKIQLETTQDKLELLDSLNQDDRINHQLQTIDLDKRKTDLLILNVPVHISQETLKYELSKQCNEEIKILNAVKTKSANLNHWRFQSSPSQAKKLLQKRRLTVLMNTYTLIKYVKIMRCSNCQNFGHTPRFCNKVSYCANCANEHLTNQCNNESEACVNCLRVDHNQYHHKATSLACPVYQYIKENFLKNYYSKISRQNKRPSNITDAVEDERITKETAIKRFAHSDNFEQKDLSKIARHKELPNNAKSQDKTSYPNLTVSDGAAAVNIERAVQKNKKKFKDVSEDQLRSMLEKRFIDISQRSVSPMSSASQSSTEYGKTNVNTQSQHQIQQSGPLKFYASLKEVQQENIKKTFAEAASSSINNKIQRQRQIRQSPPPLTKPNNIPLSFNPKGKRTSQRDSHLEKYIKNPPPPFTTVNQRYE